MTTKALDETAAGAVPAQFAEVKVRLRVVLPPSRATLDELAHLEAGSLLRLEARSETPVELVVNGQALAEGQVVSVGGRRAFALARVL